MRNARKVLLGVALAMGSFAAAQDAATVPVRESTLWAEDAGCAPEKSAPEITLSGGFNLAMITRWSKGINNVALDPDVGKRRGIRHTSFGTDVSWLKLKIQPSENSWLTVKLDIDDAWNAGNGGALEQDDFLEEVFFTFDNIVCTGFGVKFGKMELPFGLDKDTLIMHPYLNNNANGAFTALSNGRNPYTNTGLVSPISQGYAERHTIEYDNDFAFLPYWKSSDGRWLVEAGVFQNRNARGLTDRRRAEDSMLFTSGVAAVTWKPVEKLTLKASAITRFDNAFKDNLAAPDRGKRRMWGTSLAADYNFDLFCRNMNVFAEWQHGENTGHLKGTSSDDIHFGLAYNWSKRLRFHLQGEWLKMRNDRRNDGLAKDADSTLWRGLFALETTLASGIVLESGYQYEWLKTRNAKVNYARDKERYGAHTYYSGLKIAF